MTEYWHSLSMPRLQDLHHHSHSHKATVAAGCLSDDASDSSTQSMRLFPDNTTATSHTATAASTTTVIKDIMGTTPPSSSSASDTEPFRMHSSNDKRTAILTSKTSTSLSLANCNRAPLTSKTPSPSTSLASLASGSSNTGRSHDGRRLLAARSWSRSRSSLTASVPEGGATVTGAQSSSPQQQQQQQAPVVVKRAKFFFCEDSDDDESDYEQEQERHQQEQEQEKEASAYRHPSLIKSAGVPLVRTTTTSRLPVFLPTVNDDQEYEEYDEYDEYDHEEEEEEEDDDEDEEDGPLFFGKKKPSIAVTSSRPQQKPSLLTPTPGYGNSKGRRSHLPPPPQNAGMERRQSLLSDLLLAEKQQKQLLLLHQQQNQRSLASSTCSTPNCLSAANSDGEGCTSSSGNGNGGGNGRPRFSTTALTPLYPAPSTATTTTPMPQFLSQRQHQTLEPNCRRTFVDPPSETEPDNFLKDDKIFLDNINEEDESFVVPKLVRTKKIYHRLDTLAASAVAPMTATASSASANSPLSPTTPTSTCTITTLSPTTTPTTTTKTTVAPIAACATAPRGPTTTSAASAAATAAAAAAAASASAATMAGWARSQVQFQLHSLVAQSQTTAQRAFLTAQSTLSDVLYRTGAK